MADHSHSHSDHHGHDHDHSHVPTVTKENERKILISFFIIFIFMVVEAVGGVISGSLALLADAGHMLTDAIALGLAYVAFRLGRRVADSQRTFGYARFEVIAGLVKAGIGLVQYNKTWIAINRPRKCDTLPLSTGKKSTFFSDQGVIAVRKLINHWLETNQGNGLRQFFLINLAKTGDIFS